MFFTKKSQSIGNHVHLKNSQRHHHRLEEKIGQNIKYANRSEGKLGPKDPAIMDSFIEPIGGFIALLAIGVMCGGLGFVSAYRNNS